MRLDNQHPGRWLGTDGSTLPRTDARPVLLLGPRGVPVTLTTLTDATATVVDRALRHALGAVHLVNAWTVTCAHENAAVAAALTSADLCLADGMPIVWLGRRATGSRAPERVYGPDLLLAVADAGRAHGLRHALLGGALGVADALADVLRARFPGIDVVAVTAPTVPAAPTPADLTRGELGTAMASIAASGAHVVWVGLGTPKQDLFCAAAVAALRDVPDAPAFVAVGAAFDLVSGRVPQAPRMLQRAGLEWAFRLAHEPRRLALRYLRGIPAFLMLVARHRCLAGEAR